MILCLMLLACCGAGAQVATLTLTLTARGVATSTIQQGTVLTLTATFSAAGGTAAPRQVNFCDASATYCTGTHLLGTATLTPAGTAVLRLRPILGTYVYKAVSVKTSGSASSTSNAASLTVTSAPQLSSTLLQASGTPGNYTLMATVFGPAPTIPTGQVSFQDTNNASYVLGTAPLTAAGPAWFESYLGLGGFHTYPYGITLGDFNGDGILDISVADFSLNHVVISLGKGDGTFQVGQIVSTQTEPTTMVAADVNADGKLDLIVSCHYGGLSVLMGNGDGTFQPPATVPAGNYPTSVTVGDFDGDGILDLAVPDLLGNTVTILLGNGDGTFHQAAQVPVAGGPQAVVTADFNGDGNADLMVGTLNTNQLAELLGNGDGTFNAAPVNPAATYNPAMVYSAASFAPLVVGDLNGDGNADLVFPSQTSSIAVLLGKGDGTFSSAPSIVTGYIAQSLALGDMNGDGVQDLIVGAQDVGQVFLALALLGKGDGTFVQTTSYGLSNTPPFVAAGDLTGDGQADAVTTSAAGDVVVLISQMTATATVNGTSPVGSGRHQVDAVYGGDTTFKGSTSNIVILQALRQATILGLSASSMTSALGQNVTLTETVVPATAQDHAATPSVTFSSNGVSIGTSAVSNGTAILVLSTLALGTDNLTATYEGDTNFSPSTSPTVPHTVTPPPPPASVILSAGPNPAFIGTPITLTAAVTGSSGAPTGTVTFLEGPVPLGSATVSNGTATIVLSALSLGPHTIVASYGGSSVYALAVSSGLVVVIQDFSLTALKSDVTIVHGGTATYPLMLSTVGGVGLAGTVNLSVTGAPTGSQITLTPPSVPAGSGVTPVTLVIRTPNYPSGPFNLAFLVLGVLLLPLRRRSYKTLRCACAILVLVAIGTGLTGCGSGWRTQNWVITVTANSGNLSRTTTLHLTSQCANERAACPTGQ